MNETQPAVPEALRERRTQFERLYGECHSAVLGYVLRRTESPDDAADAIAETFLIAWRRIEELPRGDERRLWLYGTARRVLANQRRGQRRRLALNQRLRTELAQVRLAAEPAAAFAELADAFKRLSAADREILALEGWEGLDAAQIALVLGCSRNAARIRLHRARRRLGDQLAHRGGDKRTSEIRALPGDAR